MAAVAFFVAGSSSIWIHPARSVTWSAAVQLVTALCVGTAWWLIPALYERNVTHYDHTGSNRRP